MLKILPVNALKDNYIWLITAPEKPHAIIVDPGDATPVITLLNYYKLTPIAIFITHHHADHTHGVTELVKRYGMPVYGPAIESIPCLTNQLSNHQRIFIPEWNIEFNTFAIPGHTRGHIAYYGDGKLFCGDTLFSGGCGRLFEGTPSQMYESLQKLQELPDRTEIYCGHEYTQDNLRFAQKVEPFNEDLLKRIEETNQLRLKNLPTVPSILALEKNTNPFLRCHIESVIQAVKNHAKLDSIDPVSIFAALREWKNQS